ADRELQWLDSEAQWLDGELQGLGGELQWLDREWRWLDRERGPPMLLSLRSARCVMCALRYVCPAPHPRVMCTLRFVISTEGEISVAFHALRGSALCMPCAPPPALCHLDGRRDLCVFGRAVCVFGQT